MDEATFEEVAAAHGVRLLVQFGSTVRGRAHEASDVDLGVVLERPDPDFREYGALVEDLQRSFPDRPVDVAILNHADPLFLKQVMDGATLLYGSTRQFQELKILAFKRYQDHRRFLALEREVVARRLNGEART
jgi:predicted nucleotidyltransferase